MICSGNIQLMLPKPIVQSVSLVLVDVKPSRFQQMMCLVVTIGIQSSKNKIYTFKKLKLDAFVDTYCDQSHQMP